MADLVYRVEDKSILLPYYRRFLVDPLLPFIPAKITPNAITHAGHLVNLAGTAVLLTLRPARGWAYFAAAIALNLYTWCDNADGAHARRTGQCSPLGELLDHGLDQLNLVYMAVLSAVAFGASPLASGMLLFFIPAAAVTTFWEQTHTGVFRMGRLNHIESVVVLTAVLGVTGALGVEVWSRRIGPWISLRDGMIWGSLVILGASMAANVYRVVRECGARPAPVIALFLAACAGVVACVATATLPAPAGLVLLSCLSVQLGIRMLVLRPLRRFPGVEWPLALSAVAVSALSGAAALGVKVGDHATIAGALGLSAVLSIQAAIDFRTGVLTLRAPGDRAAVSSGPRA